MASELEYNFRKNIPMTTTSELCKEMAVLSSEIQEILSEHISDYDEILPHVFFGDVTRYVLSDGVDRKKVVLFMETHLERASAEVENLIALSFVFNLGSRSDYEHATRGLSTTNLLAEWNSLQS